MSAEVSAALIVALLLEELRIGPPEVRDHKFLGTQFLRISFGGQATILLGPILQTRALAY
ncbi:unnamed protein product [Prunus armeniaca]|uniref:Uncharacterized protein n=1 Tax=Prunus armeniaca TaxID=36596 RepID=A0A6J5W1B3_PRUAR|nr:unnamed protein product [Prunus armeniaca]